MKTYICVAAMIVLVSGCQTIDDFAGEGPVTLSPGVAYHFNEKYLTGAGPAYYVIPADGTNAYYSYCPSGPGTCLDNFGVVDSISRCERDTGQKCFVFAEGEKIVWKGPVSFGELSPAIKELLNLSNAELCEQAIDRRNTSPSWSTLPEHKVHVALAKYRRLTPDDC